MADSISIKTFRKVAIFMGSVFVLTIATCSFLFIRMINKQTEENINEKCEVSVEAIQNFTDSRLQAVEDIGYTFISSLFKSTIRKSDQRGYVALGSENDILPGEEEFFRLLERLLNSNPLICGVAIGFEKNYHLRSGEYGFSTYVTNVSGINERINLGKTHDFHEKEWYRHARSTNSPYWSNPFKETSRGQVVTCFCFPLHDVNRHLIGVLALDINTHVLMKNIQTKIPFDNSTIFIISREHKIVSSDDPNDFLKSIMDIDNFAGYEKGDPMREKILTESNSSYVVPTNKREIIGYIAPIARNGWTIYVESSKDALLSNALHARTYIFLILAGGVLMMLIIAIGTQWIIKRYEND